jgi:hypothetical protein
MSGKRISLFGMVGIVCLFFSLLGCTGDISTSESDQSVSPGSDCAFTEWTTLAGVNFGEPTLSVMFRDEFFGIATNLNGGIYFTDDGGNSWTFAARSGLSRVALEMTGDNIWHVGFGGEVTRSSDNGRTWQVLSSLPHSGHIEYMSFADDVHGWAVTTELRDILVTNDGARTWGRLPLPDAMGRPAALHMLTPSDVYLLDTDGNLFATHDDGQTWDMLSINLPENSTIPTLNHSAAMRFTDVDHGFIALNILVDGSGRVFGLRTTDSGITWVQESIPVPMGMFHLTRDGIYLTHVDLIDQGKITLLCSK